MTRFGLTCFVAALLIAFFAFADDPFPLPLQQEPVSHLSGFVVGNLNLKFVIADGASVPDENAVKNVLAELRWHPATLPDCIATGYVDANGYHPATNELHVKSGVNILF